MEAREVTDEGRRKLVETEMAVRRAAAIKTRALELLPVLIQVTGMTGPAVVEPAQAIAAEWWDAPVPPPPSAPAASAPRAADDLVAVARQLEALSVGVEDSQTYIEQTRGGDGTIQGAQISADLVRQWLNDFRRQVGAIHRAVETAGSRRR